MWQLQQRYAALRDKPYFSYAVGLYVTLFVQLGFRLVDCTWTWVIDYTHLWWCVWYTLATAIGILVVLLGMYSVFFRDLSALLLYAITTALFLLWDIFNIVDYLVYGFWHEWYYTVDFFLTCTVAVVLIIAVALSFVLYRQISSDTLHSQPIAYVPAPNRAYHEVPISQPYPPAPHLQPPSNPHHPHSHHTDSNEAQSQHSNPFK